MIKHTHRRLFISSLLVFIMIIPSYGRSTGYKEILICISESLDNEVKLFRAPERKSLIKQSLHFSEDMSVVHIADIPSSTISRWYLVRYDEAEQQQVEMLNQNNNIQYLQENNSFTVHIAMPNDSLYQEQWYLSKIQAFDSWNLYTPNDDIIMAIIDTGIDYHHPDLVNSLWINNEEDLNHNGTFDSGDINNFDDDGNGYIDDVIGWDFTDALRFPDGGDYSEPDNDPMDEYPGGHGTKIAGIIAAQTSNSIGIAALTPGARVMDLRAGTASGFLEEDDVARAILYAVTNGARVINMSFGDFVVSRFLKDVIQYAYSEGVVIIASSGNSGDSVTQYPAGLPETISVGASDRSDNIAGFSSWGNTLDLVAPGVDIISLRSGGGYELANGTSFSAPMVTAAAGLLLSNHPQYSPEQIRNILKSSADDIGIYGWDELSGSGRVNMYRAAQVNKESSLFINYPSSGTSVASDSVPVVITAIDPDLVSINLSYALGTDAQMWHNLITAHPYQVLADTITVLSLSSIADTTIVLRLNLTTWQGKKKEYRTLFSIDRTAPLISEISHLEVFNRDELFSLIEFKTDDITSADIFYKAQGSNEPYDVIHLEYETDHHSYLLNYSGDLEFYIRVKNLGGLQTIDDNNGQNYKITSVKGIVNPEEFKSVDQSLPAGFMLPEATDFDNDGNYEAVLSIYDESGFFGPVAIYEYAEGEFILQTKTTFVGIPRAAGDADNDGKPDLLIGFGQKSFLLEASQPDDWPTTVVWSDTGAFWAGGITDLDNDGRNELVGKEGQNFVLLESVGDNQFQKKYTFTNPSPGENQLGPPRTEVADLDNDGRSELYFGDYDGDLIIYENSGNDMFEPGMYIRLQNKDATNYLVSGNFKSSGGKELVAGSHTDTQFLTEYQVDSQYWDYSVISSDQNNNYLIDQHLYINGYADVRNFESGLNSGPFKSGDVDYLFLAPFPDLYLFKSNGDSLVAVWYKNNVNTNTVLIHDYDKNGISEFYFNDGTKIIGFEQDLMTRPSSPDGFQAFPLDTNLISLKWNQISGADRYVIYRGASDENLTRYDSTTTEIAYVDSTVINHQRYYYAIQTVDFSFENERSRLSATESAVPNQPPSVDTLIIKNITQIDVYFNEPMDINTLEAINFSILSEDNPVTSATAFLNGKAVLLSFSDRFVYGMNYDLEMIALRDTSKTPLPEKEKLQSFVYLLKENNKPYVQEWKFEEKKSLIVKFNVPMNSDDVLDISNYKLEPSGTVLKVESTNESNNIFRLLLSHDTYGPKSGVTTLLTLRNLHSLQGEILEEGNQISLVESVEDIGQLVVYPQPAMAERGWLMFSNIAPGTSIKIFDSNGHYVAGLEEQDENGGVRWDLRDTSGNKVSSGIYIYYATFENQTKLGKFTIVK